MLIWLSGSGSTKDAPNENYGRELMELFTLGVGTRLQRARRARAGARADRLPRTTGTTTSGPINFRFERDDHDAGVKRIFGKRGRFDWRDSCQLCLEHRSHASFFVTKLWSYFIPVAPPRRTQRALERLYLARDYDVRPVLEAILRHPLFYRGPRMVKPPIVYIAGLLRGMGRGIDTEAWVWLADLAGQQLFYPPDVAGWQEDRWLDTSTWRGRWMAAVWASREQALEPGKDTLPLDEQPSAAVERALDFWGDPSISRGDALARWSVRQALPDRRQPQVEAGAVPAPVPERAAHDGRHLSRPPDLLMSHRCCEDFSRTELLRRAAASTARALPDAGPTHAAAGRQRALAAWLPARSAGVALSVYGASKLNLAAFEEGVAEAAAGPAQPILVSIFLSGGIDSRVGAGADRRPHLSQAAPDAGARRGRRNAVRRGRSPALAPGRGRTLHAPRRGQGDRDAGHRLRPPRPVALQLAPLLGGRGARPPAANRLDGPLPRPRRQHRQPASGPLLRRPPGARAGAGARAGRHGQRAGNRSTSAPAASGARSRAGCTSRWRRSATATPAAAMPACARPVASRCRPRRFGASSSPSAATTSPARSPTRRRAPATSPRAWPRWRAMIGAGLPLRCVAVTGPGGYDTHDDQPQDLEEGLKGGIRDAARLPARPRGARDRRPRAGAGVVGVRPPRRGERLQGNRSRRRRHRLPDRHSLARLDGRRVPGPGPARRGRQPARHLRLPRRSTAGCSSSGSAPTRPR